MSAIAKIVSLCSGFILMGYSGPAENIIATSIIINLALAPLTAVIASRRGRSTLRWIILGLLLGAWALGAVLILPENRPAPPSPAPQYPPTSDAA
jgi:hypothetical protein